MERKEDISRIQSLGIGKRAVLVVCTTILKFSFTIKECFDDGFCHLLVSSREIKREAKVRGQAT